MTFYDIYTHFWRIWKPNKPVFYETNTDLKIQSSSFVCEMHVSLVMAFIHLAWLLDLAVRPSACLSAFYNVGFIIRPFRPGPMAMSGKCIVFVFSNGKNQKKKIEIDFKIYTRTSRDPFTTKRSAGKFIFHVFVLVSSSIRLVSFEFFGMYGCVSVCVRAISLSV